MIYVFELAKSLKEPLKILLILFYKEILMNTCIIDVQVFLVCFYYIYKHNFMKKAFGSIKLEAVML